jgi:uncharacterized protein
MKKALLLFVVAAFVLPAAGCQKNCNLGGIENSVPNMIVQGEGRVEAVPDEAIVSFGVSSEDRALSKAYADNTEKMNKVISTVKAMGIEAVDIRTSSYSVAPVYPRDENGRQLPGKPVSFNVKQQLTVTIRDIGKTGDLIDKVISSGANTFNGISFDSSRLEELGKEAMTNAAKDAKGKAVLLAGALGVRIGKVLKVNGSSSMPYPLRSTAQYDAMATRAAPQIEAGSMEVTANCNVTYEIVQ